MSIDHETIAIEQIDDIRLAFDSSLTRLGMSSFKVDVDDGKHPIDAATHPAVMLSRLAMRAEEISMLVFGARLFPNACYLVSKESPCGMIIQHFDDLNLDQQLDRNIQQSQDSPVVTKETITRALMTLVIETAIADTFEIDPKLKLVKIKPHNMTIHGLFKTTQEYEDGQGLPLLDGNMVALSDLHGMLLEEAPLVALQKARDKAYELDQQNRLRYKRDGLEGDIDAIKS